jgi:PhzF family phenazine biosynthesis protein
MRLPLFHVNAFTNQPLGGNPAAVCLLDSWLDDRSLRKVAAENNLSATGFLLRQGNDYDLRWFTPLCEVKLCGHATLASGHVALNVLRPDLDKVRFSTRFHGPVSVQKQAGMLAMDFPALFPEPCTNVPTALNHALGLTKPPSEVFEANDILVAVLDTSNAVQELRPDFELLEQLHPHAVLVTASGHDCDFISRYFAPGYGVPEDPVTGSAHCVLTPYWTKRLGKPQLHARQLSPRGGELWCEMAGERVILKGQAVLTLQGTLEI